MNEIVNPSAVAVKNFTVTGAKVTAENITRQELQSPQTVNDLVERFESQQLPYKQASVRRTVDILIGNGEVVACDQKDSEWCYVMKDQAPVGWEGYELKRLEQHLVSEHSRKHDIDRLIYETERRMRTLDPTLPYEPLVIGDICTVSKTGEKVAVTADRGFMTLDTLDREFMTQGKESNKFMIYRTGELSKP